MLVVKLEIWPGGSFADSKEIGRLHIANDETGTAEKGNYTTWASYKGWATTLREGRKRIHGHDRSVSPWLLVMKAIKKLYT